MLKDLLTNWKHKYEIETRKVKLLRMRVEAMKENVDTPEPMYAPEDFYAPATRADAYLLRNICRYSFVNAITARDTTGITRGEIKPVRMYKLFVPEDYFHQPDFEKLIDHSSDNIEFEVGEVEWFLDADEELIIFARLEK